MILSGRKKLAIKLRAAALAGLAVLMLGGCGSTDLASIEGDTFVAQAMPLWLIPKLRDDYMGKQYLQPLESGRPALRDESGKVVADPPLWDWPRGWPWPWPLPNPSPGR